MSIRSRRLIALAGAVVLSTALLPTTALPVAAAGGSEFVAVANQYRAAADRGPVALNALVDQVAVERGRQLAEDGALGHDFAYVQRRFDELGICWTGMGEIVAYNSSGDYDRFGQQWFNSTPHREIMLGDYTHAGGSREQGGDGRFYGVMIFAKLCGAAAPASPSTGFTDIASSPFVNDIRWLVGEGITAGCSASRYCPLTSVTRDQMASFLRRATGIPTSTVNAFSDDNSSQHEADINGVAVANLTGGCAEARYCPGAVVTRGQMASFLARALRLPAATRDWFGDDNGSMHEGSINRLAEAGITGGCASGRFCPGARVTREQMAGFLHRAFGS